ncbi:MAG TPA: T9SS type A sorting domain-containing protein, partial [Ignavibacteria bacterium]|nr:T9SS type A sorting domain-containing protein [Ignavibacteria bacterium]
NSGVFLSQNNGTSWSAVNNGLTNPDISSLELSGSKIYAGTGDGVYLSQNNGQSWSALNNGMTNQNVKSIVFSGSRIFAGTDAGVYLSQNNGNSWTAVNNGLLNLNINSLSLNGSMLYAATGSGIFFSQNNGSSWTGVNNGLTNLNVNSFGINGTNIFAGTDGGVFLTINSGQNWVEKNQGFDSIPRIYSMLVAHNYVFAGTGGQSIWIHALPGLLSLQNIPSEVPSGYKLEQNFPNPFNPATNIKFSIPKSSLVRLSVFNVAGMEVETLLNETLTPGTYQTSWEASKYSSGVYFCKLQSESFSETKRMILIK